MSASTRLYRGFAVVAGLLILIAIGLFIGNLVLIADDASSASPAPLASPVITLETPNCPTGASIPQCETQRQWNLFNIYNVDEYRFEASADASDVIKLVGAFALRISNFGAQPVHLTSVLVTLEQQVAAGTGNSITDDAADDSDSFAIVVAAALSVTPVCGQSASVCNGTQPLGLASSTNSTLRVTDELGNSIATLGSVPVQAVPASAACSNGTAVFHAKYELALSPALFAALLNKTVRLRRYATVTAANLVGAGPTCAVDTMCNSVPDATVRTVQSTLDFVMPSTCPLRCGCVESSLTLEPPYSPDVPFITGPPTGNLSGSLCSTGFYSAFTPAYAECPLVPVPPYFHTFASIATLFAPNCDDLIANQVAAADHTINCPSLLALPAPVLESSDVALLMPPPTGAVCTLTLGAYSQSPKCSSTANTGVCANRRTASVSTNCIVNTCLNFACYRCQFNITAALPASTLYTRVDIDARTATNNATFNALIRKFLDDNKPGSGITYGLFTANRSFTPSFLTMPKGAMATSARQFGRQLLVAELNRLLTHKLDNATQQAIFESLVFMRNANCTNTVPVWANTSVGVAQVINFSQCLSGLDPRDYATRAAFVTSCRNLCGNNTLCALVGPYYSFPKLVSLTTGRSLPAELSVLLELYNDEFDHAHASAYSHTHSYSYSYSHSHAYPYAHSHTNSYSHSHSYAHANSDTHSHADVCRDLHVFGLELLEFVPTMWTISRKSCTVH